MPEIFSNYHDSLLQKFLKNFKKKVNTDERVLLGKDKHGMIFQIQLKLQRTLCTVDELLFVANIRRYKTRENCLLCICNSEG